MEICIAYSADALVWYAYDDGDPVFYRGSDTYLCIGHAGEHSREYFLYSRAEISTDIGWREVRGVNTAKGELFFEKDHEKASQGTPSPTPPLQEQAKRLAVKRFEEAEGHAEDPGKITPLPWLSMPAPERSRSDYPFKLLQSWYLDKEGKTERYRRQVYSFSVQQHNGVYIGLAQVIEFPKELDVKVGCTRPEVEMLSSIWGKKHRLDDSDVMRTYLVTSRDGITFDFEWIYAGMPILPVTSDYTLFRNVWAFPSIVGAAVNRVFFAANSGNHERWGEDTRETTVFGVATWDKDRLSGIAAGTGCASNVSYTINDWKGRQKKGHWHRNSSKLADDNGYAIVTTKAFLFSGERLTINACVRSSSEEGHLSVDLLAEGNTALPLASSRNISGVDSHQLDIGANLVRLLQQKTKKGEKCHLRFRIRNAALYALELT
jgi:hypothetical protein